MGQAGNSNRKASLDDRKERAAGRRGEREMIKEAVKPRDMKGKTGGAFCSYVTPDLHPYILQTYLDKMDDVMTVLRDDDRPKPRRAPRPPAHGSEPLPKLSFRWRTTTDRGRPGLFEERSHFDFG